MGGASFLRSWARKNTAENTVCGAEPVHFSLFRQPRAQLDMFGD